MPDPHVTIPDEDPVVQYTVGGSPDDSFAIPFSFFDSAGSDVVVYNSSSLVSAADYTIAGDAGTTGGFNGGTLTLDTPVTNTVITILRDVPIARTTDFPTSGPFNIASLNTQLDKLFAILQQQERVRGRAITIPDADLVSIETTLPIAASRASKLMGFDEDGSVTVSTLDTEEIEDAVSISTAQAVIATAQAVISTAQAAISTTKASEASVSAAAAAASAAGVNLPSLTAGNTGKTLVVNAGSNGFDLSATTLAAQISAAILARSQLEWPVGRLWINEDSNTNPASILGFGTWVQLTDTFVVAHGSTYTATGGAATVTLTNNELPAHPHTFPLSGDVSPTGSGGNIVQSSGSSGTKTTSSTGTGAAFSIIPPYRAAYIFKRTV